MADQHGCRAVPHFSILPSDYSSEIFLEKMRGVPVNLDNKSALFLIQAICYRHSQPLSIQALCPPTDDFCLKRAVLKQLTQACA